MDAMGIPLSGPRCLARIGISPVCGAGVGVPDPALLESWSSNVFLCLHRVRSQPGVRWSGRQPLSGLLGPDHHLLSELQYLPQGETREDLPVLQDAVREACGRPQNPCG